MGKIIKSFGTDFFERAIACPVCEKGIDGISQQCDRCFDNYRDRITTASQKSIIDLTPAAILDKSESEKVKSLRAELFRFQKISLLCEKLLPPLWSMNMLLVLQGQMEKERIPQSRIAIVRGDVEALPFLPNSIDAIYVGAALHCWDNPKKKSKTYIECCVPAAKSMQLHF